jgi:hypothetical protein
MGATPLVRWQFSHDRWRMGAISLVKVTARGGVCPPNARLGTRAAATNPTQMIKATRFSLGFDELFIVIDASLTTTKSQSGLPRHQPEMFVGTQSDPLAGQATTAYL